MKLDNLTVGERFIVEWQYGMLGDFRGSLMHAIMAADEYNLAKLTKGFPDEVLAFQQFSRVDGWWEKVQFKAEI